jgi:quercetin dioxygenase-like cupin family protein
MRTLALPAALAILAACGTAPQQAPEQTKQTPPAATTASLPEGATVVFEGDYASATLFELRPGQVLPRHDGPNRVVYALGDYTLEWTRGDEAPASRPWKAGDVHWHAAGPHAAKNVGDGPARYLVVSRTTKPLPAGEAPADAAAADAGPGRVLFENDTVRLVEIALAPGEETPRHRGGHRLVYALGDYALRFTEGDAPPKDVSWKAGEAHWHGPAEHVAKNVGEGPARYLVFTFRS